MKKLLYIPLGAGSQYGAVEDDLFRAFSKEFSTYLLRNIPDFEEFNRIRGWNPDIVHIHAGALPLSNLKILKDALPKAVFSCWTGDAKYSPIEGVLRHKYLVDYVMLSTAHGQQEMYQKFMECSNCEYDPEIVWMPEVVADWQIPAPKTLETGKIIFVGNHYDCFPGGEERLELFRFLTQRFGDRFEVYGEFRHEGVNCKGPIPWEKVPELYNDAFIVIGMDNYFDIKGYFTHRHIGAMGTSCCLSRVFEGMDEIYPPSALAASPTFRNFKTGVHFRNKYEAHDMIQFLLDNPGIRNEIAKCSHEEIKKNWTYDNWVQRFKFLTE